MKKLLIGSYIFFLLYFVAFSYLFIDPGLFYLKVFFTDFFQLHRLAVTTAFVISVLIFFSYYFVFLLWVKNRKLVEKDIRNLIIATVVILIFAYPAMVSFDIFNYIATAKVTFFYHENPYIIMPIAFQGDPLLLFMHAANKTALYAPFWILLTSIPHFLGANNFLITLFSFKILIASFYAATVFLLWKMTKNIFQTAFFALNPLVIIETLVSGHNDISMAFLLLISFYFLFKNKGGRSILFYVLSIGIKYATGILAPLFIWHWIKPLEKKRFFLYSTVLMYIIFFLSSFREEIYPWYAIWFLVPQTFLAKNNFLTWVSLSFSFSLLLRYIPFMLLGTYFGPTPVMKIALTFIPVLISVITFLLTQKERNLV